jgi:hypothetical protein
MHHYEKGSRTENRRGEMQKHNINLKKEIYKDAPAGTKDKRA